jgi:hypothetical protein
MAFGIYQFYNLFQPGFRRRRIELFLKLLRPDSTTNILDVGGFAYDWDGVVPVESPVTLLNLYHPVAAKPLPKRFVQEVGDGCNLRHLDQSFAIAYSNSVIEHLHTLENQRRFAAELRRVGRQVFVQTPNRWFPIEPHFVTAFIHFLPWRIAQKLLPIFSFRGLFRSGDNMDTKKLATELRLLSCREMKALFPDCEIHREKWLGLTKSIIAVRRSA